MGARHAATSAAAAVQLDRQSNPGDGWCSSATPRLRPEGVWPPTPQRDTGRVGTVGRGRGEGGVCVAICCAEGTLARHGGTAPRGEQGGSQPAARLAGVAMVNRRAGS